MSSMAAASNYKHILFDLGNVLIPIHFDNCFKIWSEASGVSFKKVKKSFVADEAYAQHERNEITAEDYCKHISLCIGAPLTFADFALGWNSIFGDLISETSSFVNDFSGQLNLYIFSNSVRVCN